MINQPFDQQIDNAESLGLKQLAQMQQTNPDFAQAIAFENLKQSLLAHQNQTDMDNRPMGQPADVIGRNELEVREMLAGMGAPTEPTQMGQPTEPTPMGLPQLSANNLAVRSAAQGGIVGYAPGGGVQEGDRPIPAGQPSAASQDAMAADVANYIKQYNDYKASLANAPTPAEKQQVENKWRVTQKSFPSDTVAAAHQKMSSASSMAGGGIVSLQGGGGVKSFQPGGAVGPTYPPPPQLDAVTGEYSFFVFDDNGQQIEVDEETYYQVTDLYDQRNRRDFPESFEPTPVGELTPEQIYQQRIDQSQGIIGPILGGETGWKQDIENVLTDPNLENWQQRAGGMAEVSGEALAKFLATLASSAGISGEYVARSGAEMIEGAGQTGALGEAVEGIQTLVQEPARREQLTNVFNEQMAALSAQLNELQNTPINLDIDPDGEQRAAAMAALQSQRDQLQAQYESTVGNFSSDMEIAGNALQDPNRWQALAELLGMESEEEKQAALNADITSAAQAAQDVAGNRVALSDDDYMLQEIANNMFTPSAGSGGSGTGGTNVAGGTGDAPEEGGRSWLDKTMDVMELLGGGAGASTGYVGQKILDTAQGQERFESQQAFEQAMQDQLLQQRTDERRMIEDQRLAIARAEALAGISLTDIMAENAAAISAKREQLEKEHDVFFGGHNEELVQIGLNQFYLELLNKERAQISRDFGGGNTPAVSGGVPSNVTVTRSP